MAEPSDVTDLVAQLWNADGDAVPNDIQLTWTADSAANATYSVHSSLTSASYPGPSWITNATDLMPVFGVGAMHFVHDDAIVSGEQRFYVVTSMCP